MTDQTVMNLSANDLLVRQVSALVHATADMICGEGENILEIESNLYKSLAANCADKAELATAFADFGRKMPAESKQVEADF